MGKLGSPLKTKEYICPMMSSYVIKVRCVEEACRIWDATNEECGLKKNEFWVSMISAGNIPYNVPNRYWSLIYGYATTTETLVKTAVPISCRLKKLIIRCRAFTMGGTDPQACVVLRKNGVDTALGGCVTAVGNVIVTESVNFAIEDDINVRVYPVNATSGSAQVLCSWLIET